MEKSLFFQTKNEEEKSKKETDTILISLKRTIFFRKEIFTKIHFQRKTHEGDDKKTTFLKKQERMMFFKTGRDFHKRGSAQSLTFFAIFLL